jgi:hypothetical protein
MLTSDWAKDRRWHSILEWFEQCGLTEGNVVPERLYRVVDLEIVALFTLRLRFDDEAE